MSAYARIDAGELVVGNALIERRWAVVDGALRSVGLLHKPSGRQWLCPPDQQRGELPPLKCARMRTAVSEEFLRVELSIGGVAYRFDAFDGVGAVTQQVTWAASSAADAAAAGPSGVEVDAPTSRLAPRLQADAEVLPIHWLHCDFVAVEISEQTDGRENLVFERRWMLHPAETHARAAGNVFFIEHRASGEGFVILKHAPAPYARPVKLPFDCAFAGEAIQVARDPYPVTIICYSGSSAGRIVAMQRLQLHLRRYQEGVDGQFLSNTWGDRNRDAALCEEFLLKEADAGARLGVDVLQIDDGWQKGRSANSSIKGGVWNGFWASDPEFWAHNPQRLPHGLSPLLDRLKQHGMGLGLWYAPDSSNDCANWQRDAEQVLKLWREQGVRHVKIDAVKIHSPLAEANVARFYERVMAESEGQVCFDPDVTAELRPGFWGLMGVGPVFVENRYTDWHRYWPHHTLRNLWRLAHYVPPVRLRMEFLNVARNVEKYAGDPLAPALYPPDTLFATVMFASPLGWFEVSHLPAEYFAHVAPLVETWKRHRQFIHTSPVLPMGSEPDGFCWTGLRTQSGGESELAVIFNERSPEVDFALEGFTSAKVLHGDAAITPGPCPHVRIHRPLGHAFVKLSRS